MSKLTYNTIELPFVNTDSLELVPEADPSGVDVLFTRFTVAITSVVTPNVVPANVGESPVQTMARVQHMLLQKRRAFTFENSGQTYIDLPAGADGAARDDAMGPEPLSCTITKLSEGSWVVAYKITCRLVDCDVVAGSNIRPRPYLSLKWSDTATFDDQWLTTRRRTGTMVLSPRAGADPDGFRAEVTPDIPPGFRRQSAEYTLNESGTVVRFSFADKELMRVPPEPAVKMTGRMVESTPQAGGVRYGDLQLRLDGPRGVDPQALLAKAVLIGMSRVKTTGVAKSGGRILVSGSVGEGLGDGDNYVEISLRWMMQPAKDRQTGASAVVRGATNGLIDGLLAFAGPVGQAIQLGAAGNAILNRTDPDAKGTDTAAIATPAGWVGAALPGCDPNRAIAPPTRGTAAVRLVAAALNDPCGLRIAPPPAAPDNDPPGVGSDGGTGGDDQGGDYDSPGNTTATYSVVPDADLPADDEDADYADDPTPGVYDTYTLVSHYTYDPGVVVLDSTKAGEPAKKVKLTNPSMEVVVEWTASRAGGRPVCPDPADSPDGNAVFLGATASVEGLELAADGVSVKFTVSGRYRFKFLDVSKASVTAPIPPFLEGDLAGSDARIAFGAVAPGILWGPAAAGSAVNPFTAQGVDPQLIAGLSGLAGRIAGSLGFGQSFP